MLSTLQQNSIRDKVNAMRLTSGLGNKHAACSVAAINLALTGELTDKIPDCMSRAIGNWIISAQDAMPDSIRNSPEWKNLLPLAAGTGIEKEVTRLILTMDWLRTTVMPAMLEIADFFQTRPQLEKLLARKTADGVLSALNKMPQEHCGVFAAVRNYWSAFSRKEAAEKKPLSYWKERLYLGAGYAASAAAFAAEVIAEANSCDSQNKSQLGSYAYSQAKLEVWNKFNPCGLLEKLINVE